MTTRCFAVALLPLCLLLAGCNLDSGAATTDPAPTAATTDPTPTAETLPPAGQTIYERYPDLPRVGDVAGMPSPDACWVSNPSGGVLVYAQPQQPETAAIAVLSNRALLAEMGSTGDYRIEFPEQVNGGTGWVDADTVSLIGMCGDGPGLGSPAMPMLENAGNPPADICAAVHPGGTAQIIVYDAGPAVVGAMPVAMLGNWAQVTRIEGDWLAVLLPGGGTGWIVQLPNESATLVGPCG